MKTQPKTVLALFLIVLLCGATAASAAIITCSSDGHERNFCRTDTRGGVVLVHQLSRAGCWQNDTWGYDRGGIWVANGCRAEFRTGYSGSERRGSHDYHHERHHDRDDDHDDKKKVIGAALAIGLIAAAAADHDDRGGHHGRSVYTCESKDERHRYCSVSGRIHHVELKRQLSRSDCRYNRSWGYDRSGIWVDDGCRAEFWVD